MGEKSNDAKKFQNIFEISYEDFFMTRFSPLLGVIQKFMEEFGEEKSLQIVSEYVDELARSQEKSTQETNQIENFNQFKLVLISNFNEEFMKNTITFDIIEDTDSTLVLRARKCLWAKVFKKLNFDGERGYRTACRANYSIANALNPHVRLSFGKTLMEGDDFCELCYRWEQ